MGEPARGLLLLLAIQTGCYVVIESAIWRAQGWPQALLAVMLLGIAPRAAPVLRAARSGTPVFVFSRRVRQALAQRLD